jgi:hypothetical protein
MIGKNKGHINTATGRNKRDMGGILKKGNGGMRRSNGKVVPKGRLQHQRDRKTGKK